jgi:hypothetical protein
MRCGELRTSTSLGKRGAIKMQNGISYEQKNNAKGGGLGIIDS